MKAIALAVMSAAACAHELTAENYEEMVEGKQNVFIEFMAPW
jgi:hypothetical protein